MDISELKKSIEGLTAAEAVEALTAFIEANPDSPLLDEAYTLRGMRHWGMQNRAAAINDYLAAIRINPDSKAVQALKATNDILDYYNKDLYNP